MNDQNSKVTPASLLDGGWIRSASRVPVEIWHKILCIAISFPLLPQDDDGYPMCNEISRFDCAMIAKYKACERDRTKLQLVCRSWNSFLDNYSDRLVHFVIGAPNGYWPPIKHWDRVVRVQGGNVHCNCMPELCWPSTYHRDGFKHWMSDPKTLPSPKILTMQDSLPLLGSQLKAIAGSVSWASHWMTGQDRFGGLLMLTGVGTMDGNAFPSRLISTVHRALTHLEITAETFWNPEHIFDLPKLRYLSFTAGTGRLPAAHTDIFGHWSLPCLQTLVLNITNSVEHDLRPIVDRLIGLVGSNVKHFVCKPPISPGWLPVPALPEDLWTRMPRLERIDADLTQLATTPIPGGAPRLSLGINLAQILSFHNNVPAGVSNIPQQWLHAIGGPVLLDLPWRDLFTTLKAEDVIRRRSYGRKNAIFCAEAFDVLDLIGSGLQDSEGKCYDEHVRMQICTIIRDRWLYS
ncbi:hypothetical protein M408DRAFT_26899 [Serendipita vermifera MAFF 305830]|uniref:Uncharacterized protein n=1 Tax=Serendipita vermifera MAFF 305830 TaxID=933852 RepID=A0A0C2X5Q6_SERVB|nr:hypothetical protein M408DRAFT_26899 [Serendipita vermifera MAFF 305830]